MNKSDKKILFAQLRDAALYWLFIPVAVIGSGFAFDYLFNFHPLPPISFLISAALLAIGFLVIFLSTRELMVLGRGTPNPGRPPKQLVQQGIYRLCRHPMFLGYDLAALGVILSFSSTGMLCISLPLFLVKQVSFLKKEERLLAKRFKTAYGAYQRRTSFLLPFLY